MYGVEKKDVGRGRGEQYVCVGGEKRRWERGVKM